ncbi:MAG: homoserine dehydrogenase [Bacteroides sp.]|nr:homoserine dehydrogenase [Eubacterium sp.]MCM1418702.1 homoserine dehydrogenase [Roseburia sp.]MCM1462730.1 homoserine dehydrogenase [Bacteroides sp.]
MKKIAVLGYGTVGSGTVEVFYKNKKALEEKAGEEMDIKYILDVRDFPDSPYADKFTKSFDEIVGDPEVAVCAEVIGGLKFSYPYVKALLEAGKSVVTSNKELVAEKGAELLRIAREKDVSFFFEASVGGGIPIIRSLNQCLSANRIDGIAGILNGTTNFILTKMIREGMGFNEALKLAQELGYAERDPSADVEGHDTCRKICILASLAFGRHVYPEGVHTEGITAITLADVRYCESANAVIKLIGFTYEKDGRVAVMTCPAVIRGESQLAGVNDVFNAVLVKGDATGDVVFYGKGAGKLPTASAVVSDVVAAIKARGASTSMYWEDAGRDILLPEREIVMRRYVRAEADPAAAKALFGEVRFLTREGAPEGEIAFLTGELGEEDFARKAEKIKVLSAIRVLND